LEEDFAREFLDKLGVKYIYQFEAKDIGRYYDFAIILDDNLSVGNMLLVEIDGSYFHSDPRLVKEGEMSPMQKRNKRVDEYKDKWALLHGIPLIRIWEKDIRENPKMVMDGLKKRLYIENEKKTLNENKRKRHVNKIK
jgi:very-short-patch-repair endonuclease